MAHEAGAYPGFSSMKRLGVFLLLPGWDASTSQGYSGSKFAGTHLYTWVKRGTVRIKCLAQEHNAVPWPRLDPESNALTIRSHDSLAHVYRFTVFLGASGTVRIDESGDRDPDYSLKYYVNGSFQNIADYNHSTGGFNLRGDLLLFLDATSHFHFSERRNGLMTRD